MYSILSCTEEIYAFDSNRMIFLYFKYARKKSLVASITKEGGLYIFITQFNPNTPSFVCLTCWTLNQIYIAEKNHCLIPTWSWNSLLILLQVYLPLYLLHPGIQPAWVISFSVFFLTSPSLPPSPFPCFPPCLPFIHSLSHSSPYLFIQTLMCARLFTKCQHCFWLPRKLKLLGMAR